MPVTKALSRLCGRITMASLCNKEQFSFSQEKQTFKSSPAHYPPKAALAEVSKTMPVYRRLTLLVEALCCTCTFLGGGGRVPDKKTDKGQSASRVSLPTLHVYTYVRTTGDHMMLGSKDVWVAQLMM